MPKKQLQKLIKRAMGLALIVLAMGASEARTLSTSQSTLSTSQSIAGEPIVAIDTGILNLSEKELIAEVHLLAQAQQPRTALVIGNASYEDAPLRNPINDATAVKDALEALGFQVTFLTDRDWHAMDRALEDFSEQLQPGGVALFYYAGHGVQVKGENYLVPVDARLNRERHVTREAISLSDILRFMEDAETAVNIVIIDACRDNPFYRRWRSASGAGLAEVKFPPEGTIISFATEPGNVTEDGDGPHSPYTSALLEHINAPDLDIGLMFRRVRGTVSRATEMMQLPRTEVALVGEFFLNPTNTIPPPSPIPPRAASPTPEPIPSSQRPTPTLPIEPTLISAATGFNYQPLRDALAAGNFREADEATDHFMHLWASRESDRVSMTELFRRFPCEDLLILDQLWLDYSDGKFGFSIQQEIYQSLGGTRQSNSDTQINFGDRVGWRVNDGRGNDDWIDYDDLTFNTSAPRGHFPALLFQWGLFGAYHWWAGLDGLVYDRLPNSCRYPSLPTEPRLISSTTGVNYQPLRDALAAGNFREADEATRSLMLQATGRESEGHLRFEDAVNFSCEDLRIIDQLWLNYSNGKFGFSIQQEIYQSLGRTSEYNVDTWKNFGDRVGWRMNNQWIFYEEFTFNTSALRGHLPVAVGVAPDLAFRSEGWEFSPGEIPTLVLYYSSLLQKHVDCSI